MRKTFAIVAAAAVLVACQSTPEDSPRATAALQPTKGNKVFGEATFEQVGDKVRVIVFVQNLPPERELGFHIHEAGDCSSGDGTVDQITLTPGPASIVGRGLIVHADPDDYKTQPTGNAGARLACGVIKAG